jgi:hypothetical protein
MSSEYPLFPDLSEAGKQEAQNLIDSFKVAFKKAAENVIIEFIGDAYCDIIPHIESDSWTNYRNKMMDGFRDYNNRLVQGEHDFKTIREQIFKEFKDEIIADLDQDNIKKIKELEEHIEFLNRCLSDRRGY